MSSLNYRTVIDVIEEECDQDISKPVLVALSGGADSMALLYLLNRAGITVEAAHCNFHLRGTESDDDQKLVEEYCLGLGIKLHCQHFDTVGFASREKVSIEMAARELRYNWFNQLIIEHGFSSVATGHHGNDSIETFFLNLVRGTGVKGLSGIQYRNGNIIRPLLGFSRRQVEDYCQKHQIPFRYDSTNSDVRFLRNKIRHDIIPVLEQMNPSFFNTMLNNMEHLKDAELLLEDLTRRFRDEVVVEEHDKVLIPVSKLNMYAAKKSILFEILRPYGFNSSVVEDVMKHLDGLSGKQFFSDTHRLLKDRYNMIVMKKEDPGVAHFWLEEGQVYSPLNLEAKVYVKPDDFRFSTSNNLVHFDADLVDLPLLFRKWKQGDQFMPLGMKQFKKVSDFFIDNKFSLVDKEQAWLAVSGEDILWIAGCRIDDRFKITGRTKHILEIRIGE